MKKLRYGLLFLSLFVITSLPTGCSLFSGLDDAQTTSVTFLNSYFAKSTDPSAEERYQTMSSLVSNKFENNLLQPEYKKNMLKFIQKFMTNGVSKPYFIADNPNDPQTETRRSIIARFPKGTFTEANAVIGINGKYNKADSEAYAILTLNKESDSWKIIDLENIDIVKEKIQKNKLEWIEVKPTDYLD
ncbi:hypothetical protein MK805_00575 [Shimazuella sp. AN120528]|uniref:hypothetical protein n=1 Tax=Shimazuella soli TaxID=1892854 RepID=UPI001F11099E|nr:hypothetical protein [Shimazuella soli]MCH5583467.1 hypothetical protein [Shimazuella soli]